MSVTAHSPGGVAATGGGQPSGEKVVLVGQGYVGLPLAMRAVEAGYDVVGLDLDVARVKKLGAGESFVEDVSSERVLAALESGRYRASHDYSDAAGFDICVITVPTPLREGIPDLSFIEESGRAIAEHVRPGCTVILESTTYPGTTEELLRPLIEDRTRLRAPEDFHLGYSPERIDPGNPTWRLENTPKVVSGVDAASLATLPARPGRGRALPADRPVIPVLAGQAHPGAPVPVHRAGQRHQRPDARACGAAPHRRPEPAAQTGQRQPDAGPGPGIQEERR
jgi:hypothetical protein